MSEITRESQFVQSRNRFKFHFSKSFLAVWLALFISLAGAGIVNPLLPIFAKDMGASGLWVGIIFSGFAYAQIPLMPVIGRLSDRLGQKFFLWVGLALYVIVAAGYYWAPSYEVFVPFRILNGIGAAMILPTAMSYAAHIAPQGHTGRYLGLFSLAMTLGYGSGPVIGGFIHDGFGVDATFLSMLALSLLGLIIIFLFMPGKTLGPRAIPSLPASLGKTGSFILAIKDRVMQGVVSIQFTYGILYGIVLAFVGIWMTSNNMSVAQVGIILLARSLMNGACVYAGGWLADRVNRLIMSNVGIVMLAVCTFFIPSFSTFIPLLGLFLVTGIFESMALPSVNSIAADRGRNLGMGSVMGINNMAISLGMVLGSLFGGAIEGSLRISAVFHYATFLSLLGMIAFNVFMFKFAGQGKVPVKQGI